MVRTELSRQVTTPEARGTELETLTRREKEVLSLIAQGLLNEKIAANLFISPRTVEKHIGKVYRKLSIDDNDTEKNARVEAATRYINQDPDFNNPFDGYETSKPFSYRQNQVLILIGQSLSNGAIAKKISTPEKKSISKKAVEQSIATIIKKIGFDGKDHNARVVMMLVSKAKLKVPIK